MKRVVIASLLIVAGSASALPVGCPVTPAQAMTDHEQQRPSVEVVFVLDTTGSMGGLIEGAKGKIWSIATAIAQAQPAPRVRMGLVGYRDRGDDYVTRATAMTEDLDTVYSELMTYRASGGGDGPESVNEAVFQAVEGFDWSTGPGVLRIVYLVGDAPPKMGYDDDVKYKATCRMARERGIIINTIQCGTMQGTREVWEEIAQHAGGVYDAIPQDGGVKQCATPYDEQIHALENEMASLMIDYGDADVLQDQHAKRERAMEVAAAASPEARADRALYNNSGAGGVNRFGRQELVSDIAEGRKSIAEIKPEELPPKLQALAPAELAATLEANQARREEIRSRMNELGNARAAFQAKAQHGAPADGFDLRVRASLRIQGLTIGITIPEPADKPAHTTETKD